METITARMRDLIVAMPPYNVLGYIYAEHIIALRPCAVRTVEGGMLQDADIRVFRSERPSSCLCDGRSKGAGQPHWLPR